MGIFDTMLTSLVNMDFFSVLFPFLLALAVFYGILTWAAGERLGKGPVGLISLILSFFVMLYAKSIPGLSNLITMASGSTLAIATVILFVIVVLGLMGIKISDIWEKKNWLMILVIVVILYAIVVGLWGFVPMSLGIPWFTSNADVWAVVIFLIIIAIAWHFMTKCGEKKEDKPKKE